MKIVLYRPQIPQNTGNIARTCGAANAGLVLAGPLGFSLADRHMKRAGLDYWDRVSLETTLDLAEWLNEQHLEQRPIFFFSSKAKRTYTSAPFTTDSILIFGSETEGLPEYFWQQYPDCFYTIPMAEGQRCINLASSAAIVLYEALRQTNFTSLTKTTIPQDTAQN
jgi:tRNA (cytidine/uridine-2'-O-)-methyltransferase